MIKFVNLPDGLTYSDVLKIQTNEFDRRVNAKRSGEGLKQDIIILVQHNPVLTIGKHGNISNLLYPAEILREKGLELVEIGRGGDITYHGPGQLTVYPIIDLQRYRLGVKDFVFLLEQVVIDTIGELGLKGERIMGKTGVWLGKDTTDERKISAIGIKCSRFISMHGLALNIGSDLSGFGFINPCGLSKSVTSVSRELGREVSVDTVRPLIEKNFIRLLLPRIPSPENS